MCSKTEVYFIDSDKDGVKSRGFFTSYEKDTESNIIIKKKLSKLPMIYNEIFSKSLSFGERKRVRGFRPSIVFQMTSIF